MYTKLNNIISFTQPKAHNNKRLKQPAVCFEGLKSPSASIPSWAYRQKMTFCGANRMIAGHRIDFKKLEKAGIENLRQISNNSVRGITLSGKHNRKFLKLIKEAGIESVIDLRGADASQKYREACEKTGLKYYNFPVLLNSDDERTFIESLPELFEIFNRGNCYIACAQGLHRTDIFLALNYLFNPKAAEVPKMYGHIAKDGFKCSDIFKKANSVFRNLNETDKARLGLGKDFGEEVFKDRKKALVFENEAFAKKFINENSNPL